MKIQIDSEKAAKFKGEEIRRTRDSLLVSCDWTMLPDSSADKEVWSAYRKALRDIPEQSGFPDEVVWPTKP